jgi:hypothetical protein
MNRKAPYSFFSCVWCLQLLENAPDSESTFADFYKVAGLRGVYLASQLDQGVEESNIR